MRLIIWTGFWAFLIDQITKYVVIHHLGLASRYQMDVFPPFLTFKYGENRGINFGLFDMESPLSQYLLVALALLISAFVLWWVSKSNASKWGLIGAGLLVGGAIGNVVDRLLYGYVLDFLNMSCCGVNNPFVFNFADVFIFAGAFLMVFFVRDKNDA